MTRNTKNTLAILLVVMVCFGIGTCYGFNIGMTYATARMRSTTAPQISKVLVPVVEHLPTKVEPSLTFEERGMRQSYSICYINIEATAHRNINFTLVQMFVLDSQRTVLDSSNAIIQQLPNGQSIMLEFAFTSTSCTSVHSYRWEY